MRSVAMKKNYPLVIIFVVLAGAAGFFVTHRTTPVLRKAKQFELSGDLQQAHSMYTAALFDLTPSIEIPDINRSRFLAPDVLKKEVVKYLTWIHAPAKKSGKEFLAALEGMGRCESRDRHDNTITEPVVTRLSPEQYQIEWNKTFFAPNVPVDAAQAALASGNYQRNLSLLVIKSAKNYTYEINLLSKATGRGCRGLLLAENSIRFYVQPGEHLLLCRSTVDFSATEIWRSNYTPIAITIPDTTSLITTELRTRIYRK
jgi:hypothetical protein